MREKDFEVFHFRINKLRIINNREQGFLFWGRLAEVKLISFVANGNQRLPSVDHLLQASSEHEQAARVRAAAAEVLNSRRIISLSKVRDHYDVHFAVPFDLYRSESIPDYFDWMLLAIESDRDVRQVGDTLNSVADQPEFTHAIVRALQLAKTVANPQLALASYLLKLTHDAVRYQMQHAADDMIGVIYASFRRHEHYPNGVMEAVEQPDLTGNMFVDYSMISHVAVDISDTPTLGPPRPLSTPVPRFNRVA